MFRNLKNFLLFFIFSLLISACKPDLSVNTNKEILLDEKCGDAVCRGPENAENCPVDCQVQNANAGITDSESNDDMPPLYLGIMVHLEGWREELSNEEMFNRHVSLTREYATLFEMYGGKLTWESKEVTDASIIWGDEVLKEMEERGHGVGVHADLGGQLDYNCENFEKDLRLRKKKLESLGVEVLHASGVVSHCDWVTAMVDAGYVYASGMVAYGVMSMPEAERPVEYRNCLSPSTCHDTYPEALEDRIHPWRMNSGLDWLEDKPDGKLVMLPASHGLACYVESAADIKCNQEFTREDIDLFFDELDRAIALRDPDLVNMYYVGWSLGTPLDMGLMEEWLQRINTYIEKGTVEWKTLSEMYQTYVDM